MKHLHSFARRAAAFLLAAVLCVCIPAAAASAATTIGGADTTLIPAEDENCLSWLFGSKDKITMPALLFTYLLSGKNAFYRAATAAFRASTRSVFSHFTPRSSRPMLP